MIDDTELAQAFQGGDQDAFRELIERYQDRLYRLAYRITTDPDDALDVVQDSFIRVHRGIKEWNGRASFYSWVYRITSNLAIDVVRRRGRDRKARDKIIREQGSELGVAMPEDDPIEAEDRARLVDQVKQAIADLPPGQRAIVALRHYEGLSLNEIAEVRGCAVGTVKSTLHQAFRKLRRLLRDELEAVKSMVVENY